VLKRAIDITFAGAALVVLFPLFVLLAVLLKLDSEGPVLYRQSRMGRNSRTFQILKLRTMRNGEQGPAITLGSDPRITRFGAWLRRWKLDEFPQLWNVLRGDMSLVGPRPVIPELAREFAAEYKHLLAVRPGLTDPASVQYCNEVETLSLVPDPLKYFKTVLTPDKLRISRNYLQTATIASDLGVIVKTVVALMTPMRRPAPSPQFESLRPRVSPPSMSQD
jgi:lipopolysaccharide/colanic/teichoic acid biosynthesis glycosyltransferase